jgi:lycopene cyclase domain-containing protein
MPLYLITASAAAVTVVLAEFAILRTGLFRRRAYWLTLLIVFAFQVPVDGWLTKLSAPIVRYAEWSVSGGRFPWDIPVEDFPFGFVLVTASLLLWERARAREAA